MTHYIQLSNEVKEALGLTDRKCNAMGGELEESKALLDAAVRGQRQVEQELSAVSYTHLRAHET